MPTSTSSTASGRSEAKQKSVASRSNSSSNSARGQRQESDADDTSSVASSSSSWSSFLVSHASRSSSGRPSTPSGSLATSCVSLRDLEARKTQIERELARVQQELQQREAQQQARHAAPSAINRNRRQNRTDRQELMATRIKQVFSRYGRTALLFHSGVFLATLSGSYAAIHSGVDLQQVAQRVPFVDLSKVNPDAGKFALAYLSTVATGPARGALTIAASPVLARLLARSRQLSKF